MSDYIQLTNISKTFGKQTVLQPLTMGFEEGMIHGIIGRNGSGKTVLMKMILVVIIIDLYFGIQIKTKQTMKMLLTLNTANVIQNMD